MTREQVLKNAKQLPKQDRIDLVLDLWETIEGDEFPLTEAQKHELDRRIAEDGAGPQDGENWEDLKAKLLKGEF